ncbi:9373_t:CDS:1, partial [Dentiscutata heterogama]
RKEDQVEHHRNYYQVQYLNNNIISNVDIGGSNIELVQVVVLDVK